MIRDRVSKVRPAQMIFDQMLWDKAEVAIEMEFLEVNKNSSLSYGLRLPTSFPLVNFGRVLNSKPSIPAGFVNFLTFGGGKTFFGIGLTDAELFASMSRAASNTLLKTTLRSLEGQAATFHIGDRFPILTAGYFGAVETEGQVFTPPPSFQFEDLGLSLKITPRVHGTGEITLEVESEFKVLGAGTVNGIPIISTRKFQSVIRLKDGEWAVMAGLLNTSEARNLSGIAGLSSIPYLGALFRNNTTNESEGQTLILFKPTLVNLPPSEAIIRSLWTGSETRPVTPL
jgi:type II secretory pathway component GspD/PulD (secretin)